MAFIDRQVLEIGFNVFDENLANEDVEFLSFFNVVPYQKLVRESLEKTSKVTSQMLKAKPVQDCLKIFEGAGICLSPSDKEDIARLIHEKKQLEPHEIDLLKVEFLKKNRVFQPEVEANLKIENRVKIARHVFFKDRFEIFNFDVPVEKGWNIIKMPVSFYANPAGDKNDPTNVVTCVDEFYFNGNNIAFNTKNIPDRNPLFLKKISIGDLKEKYNKLIRQCVYLSNEELYDVLFYWVLHTFLYKIWSHTAYLNIVGSTSSGKSTLLKSIKMINGNSTIITAPTTAIIYRLANSGMMLLWDESENLKNIESDSVKDQLSILRAGFDKETSFIPRCNEDNDVVLFSAFCPKIICAETDIPESLESLRNRMYHLNMVTSSKPLRDIQLLKSDFETLAQEFVDFCYSNFSWFYLLALKFQDIIELKQIRYPAELKPHIENLQKFHGDYHKLKHRLQDISKPILTLASWQYQDLCNCNAFLLNQQEYLLNEIKASSPQYNLLKALNDIIDKNFDSFETWTKDAGMVSYKLEDFVKLDLDNKNPTLQVSHFHLKALLRAKYNVMKCEMSFVQEVFKTFHVKLDILKPHNRVWYQFQIPAIQDAFRRKQISLGIDQSKLPAPAPPAPAGSQGDKVVITIEGLKPAPVAKDSLLNSIKDKVAEFVANAKETTLPDLRSALNLSKIEESECLSLVLEILEHEGFIETKPDPKDLVKIIAK